MSNPKNEFKRSLVFRVWFYFRQGWLTYFAFIFAAINTMVVTYYLAIEKIPVLEAIFPSFSHYVIIMVSIGAPLLALVGYVHFRRSRAYGSEQDVLFRSNPYMYKLPPGFQKEIVMPLQLVISSLLIKIATNQKPTEEELNRLKILQEKLDYLIKGGTIGKT